MAAGQARSEAHNALRSCFVFFLQPLSELNSVFDLLLEVLACLGLEGGAWRPPFSIAGARKFFHPITTRITEYTGHLTIF
jgi:hypothetical protein